VREAAQADSSDQPFRSTNPWRRNSATEWNGGAHAGDAFGLQPAHRVGRWLVPAPYRGLVQGLRRQNGLRDLRTPARRAPQGYIAGAESSPLAHHRVEKRRIMSGRARVDPLMPATQRLPLQRLCFPPNPVRPFALRFAVHPNGPVTTKHHTTPRLTPVPQNAAGRTGCGHRPASCRRRDEFLWTFGAMPTDYEPGQYTAAVVRG